MKRILAALFLAAAVLGAGATVANADPQPPTNGGNGAGQSGQCTGPADERPASCQSSK
jgi:opacity protein-like surface antigen